MIEFCKKNNLPIDFISTHSYGVKQGFLDEYGNSGTVLDKNPMSVSGDVLQSRKEIADSSKPNLELHYTEWSASYTPADPIHDSYHEAAYILQKLKQVGNAANLCRIGFLPIFLKNLLHALHHFMEVLEC